MAIRSMIVAGLILTAPRAFAFDHTHAKWDKFLREHVVLISGGNASQVNYAKAKGNQDLEAYTRDVQTVTQAEYNGFSDAEKQALLINAYNALTVKLILDNGIPKSIKDTGSLLRSPWKKKFFKFLGEDSDLDRLEHELARGQYNNCRFHFGFNCASIGCPMLRNEAFVAAKLTAQLEDSAKRFLSDSSRNTYDAKSNTLELSKIFDWYGDDFVKDKTCGGSVPAFVSRYMKGEGGKPIPENAKVKFQTYDWNLNAAK